MYRRTLNSATFMARAANHSTKGSRRGYELLDHGDSVLSVLTPEEQRDSLVAHVKKIDEQIRGMDIKDPHRVILGKQKLAIQNQITAIRPKLKGDRTVAGHFISIARERLPKALFQTIMSEASERARLVRERDDCDAPESRGGNDNG